MADTSSLLWGLIFSSIGLGYFIYGRKQRRPVTFWAGAALIVYPYFVAQPVGLVVIGLVLILIPLVVR